MPKNGLKDKNPDGDNSMRTKQLNGKKMMRVVGLLLALCVFGLSGYNAWAADAGNEQFLKIITEQENAVKLLEAGDYE